MTDGTGAWCDVVVQEASVPREEQWRALARSSPWLWRTLRFDLERRRAGERTRLRARLVRGQGVRVEQEGADAYVAGDEGSPGHAWEVPVTLDADGLVRVRPPGTETAQDAFWRDYLWVAMLDPHELADGRRSEDRPGTLLSGLASTSRHGRETWWATVEPTSAYDPRCTCCALLMGEVAANLLAGEEPPSRTAVGGWPSRWLVGLDRQTGVVVSLEALDGPEPGAGFSMRVHGVDEERVL